MQNVLNFATPADKLAARIKTLRVIDAIDRVVRFVTLGDVVPLSSEIGARGEWRAVEGLL